ncbi:hypothetical protein [Flexibacterium corallicola]|uniref:hypothetical protein n=1 Tax=Flexibacterium corallicola TaxID=3037259 RepID=UPI00286F23D3|nr:hypothetical protein [Pseudovibrio sp. M1P-2-3]
MDTLYQTAYSSVFRFCGVYTVGTLLIMAGLSFDLTSSFRTGALLLIFLSGILLFKAWRIPHFTDHGKTEFLAMEEHGSEREPTLAPSQTDALCCAYFHFSKISAVLAVSIWLISLISALAD